MSEPAGETKLEVKQASKEAKESENVAEKYSAMTVSKNAEVNMGELSPAFSAVPTHKPVKKVRAEAKTNKQTTTTKQVVYAEQLCTIAASSERDPSLHTCIKYFFWIAHSHCSRPHTRTVKQFPALPLRS